MSDRFNYQRYLASREWALLRRQVRERCDGVCERCHCADMGAVHHLTYERIGHEDLDDLQAVCNACHDWLSGVSDVDPDKDRCDLVEELLDEAVHLGLSKGLPRDWFRRYETDHPVGLRSVLGAVVFRSKVDEALAAIVQVERGGT